MSYIEQIDRSRVPQHIAVIMDGNGRWAKAHNRERSYGHQCGVDALRNTINGAIEAGVKYLTVYTFSTENWSRPDEEVTALMSLMVMAIESETPNLMEKNVRLTAIGDLSRMPADVLARLRKCEEDTQHCTGVTMVLALSYSARWEILQATQQIAQKVKAGALSEEEITEELFANHLTTQQIPHPDLLIRTGGEMRISNFLLWQVAYAELYFTPQYWPDFNEESLYQAICDYQSRERRFGKISEQL